MGLDMWLPSIFDYSDGDAAERVFSSSPKAQAARASGDPMALATAFFDALRATGGYYREANPFGLPDLPGTAGLGLFTALGLSWRGVFDALEDKSTMPVDHARHLLVEIECKPITPAMINDLYKVYACDTPRDEMREWLNNRRDGLMSLLRKAIERDEPLMVSA